MTDSNLPAVEGSAPASVTRSPRLFTFRSGGWVLLASALLCVTTVAWAIFRAIERKNLTRGKPAASLLTNGFDLSDAVVPVDSVRVPFKRDGLPPLVVPPALPFAEVQAKWGKKYLVRNDRDERVIGVAFGGETRAYPLRVMNWHEIVNDIVGGIPILVTYHPPCDSVAVFDRRHAGAVREFGHSGLVYNGNLLVYDQPLEDEQPSLWSQLRGQAISGPRSGERLLLLQCALTTLGDWLDRNPESTIVPGMPSLYSKAYKQHTYGHYLFTKKLQLEVDPLPPAASGRALFDPLIVLGWGGDTQVLFYDDIARAADDTGRYRTSFPGLELELLHRAGSTVLEPATVVVVGPVDPKLRISYSLYFAWYAAEHAPVKLPAAGGAPADHGG